MRLVSCLLPPRALRGGRLGALGATTTFGDATLALFVVILSVSASAQTVQTSRQESGPASPAAADKAAEAYGQFLLGRHLEGNDDVAGAIAAFKRAIELDPLAADVPAELAALYLRQSRAEDAVNAAEQALKVAPTNREAHRVLGIIYAALSESERGNATPPRPSNRPSENVTKAIRHLEQAIERPVGEVDPNVRATLGRLYVRNGDYGKAIPLLSDLIKHEPGWQDGPALLAEAYSGAGRHTDAIAWLEEAAPNEPRLYATLADFYEREGRWKDAAGAYTKALQRAPRSTELRTRYAAALLKTGGRDDIRNARDVLAEVLAAKPTERTLYMMSQAERRLGDLNAAEATARKVIAQNAKSPWGYYALAETLEERRQYQAVIDVLTFPVSEFRTRGAAASVELGLLLPHLGFAHQELGQFDKAIAIFDEARRLSPKDPAVAGYLIQANLAAKRYADAAKLAREARAERPNDLRLARLEAQALRRTGKAEQGVALLEDAVKNNDNDPSGYVALAQLYADVDRGAQAIKVLQDAQAKFPTDVSISFELGAVLDKQKRFADAEAAFQQVLARDPENAPALNYLGYMLAERGERLDESVGYLKKALQIEPENGSYLDSLGWAYFKADKLHLAEESLKRAAEQLKTNSVIQEHYGELLFKLGRFDEAIAAWTRALAGDGDSIDRADIDRKIRTAKQKLGKK